MHEVQRLIILKYKKSKPTKNQTYKHMNIDVFLLYILQIL